MFKPPFRISSFLLIVLLVLSLWINLPAGKPIKFAVGPVKVDRVIRPPVIDTTLFGRPVYKEFVTKLGLDLRGGSHLLFEADVSKIPATDREEALESARNIMAMRVDPNGVSEPDIKTVRVGDAYRISLDLPGVENVEEAVRIIGATAQLEFREEVDASTAAMLDAQKELRGSDSAGLDMQQQEFLDFIARFKPSGLDGSHVKKAAVQFGGGGTQVGPSVQLIFNKEGADLFEEITARNVGKPLGIFLDGIPISVPTVQQRIIGNEASITGTFTIEEVRRLVSQINSGALPVPVKLIEQRNIGPSLGQESIEKSLFAGILGLTSVLLFMIVYYRTLGVIAAVGLALYALLSLALFRAIPVVLTLPGVAGFILSVGMAVDANILIFERIKEEERKGKRFDVAMQLGFGKAMDAIKDANIATLLVAFILFNPLNWSFFPQFGLIRGFALTLAIGVLTSLFTGIFITKRLMQFVFARKLRS